MGTFTIPLKKVIELTGGTTEIVNGISKLTGGNIGLAYYPLWDETYRDHLNGIIVDHYWNREIGLETIDMFQLNMRKKMNEIMPYYNKFYESLQIEFDPLKTIDLSTASTGDSTQNSTNTGSANSEADNTGASRSVNSETPQTMLSGDADYATSAADSNSTSKTTGTNSQTGTADSTDHSENNVAVSGYQGVPSDLVVRYRDSIVNVDIMILGELEELFMQVWDTGDSYTNNPYPGFILL